MKLDDCRDLLLLEMAVTMIHLLAIAGRADDKAIRQAEKLTKAIGGFVAAANNAAAPWAKP